VSCDACPRVLDGWFRGCATATATLGAVVLFLIIRDFGSIEQALNITCFMALLALPLTMILTCLLTALPAGLVIWFSERLSIRSGIFYAGVGAVIGVLIFALIIKGLSATPVVLPQSAIVVPFSIVFGVAGCLAGIAYWFVAGRHAGAEEQ